MYAFDEHFTNYCNRRNWKYSRYADDIYISAQEYLPSSLQSEVNEKLHEIGFSSNAINHGSVQKNAGERLLA